MDPRIDLRAKGDTELQEKLLEDADIRRAVERAKDAKEEGIRRHLLATAVRVTREMSPELHGIAEHCRTTLGIDAELETYVFPSSSFIAATVKPENGRVLILLSSSLLESFDSEELSFVIGHELGHHVFSHHEFPIGALLENPDTATGPNALKIFAWARYAEISADRAGIICAGSLEPVARAFFKLASGLTGGMIDVHAEGLLDQIGDMRLELERESAGDAPARQDWFATHPFSPLRLQAAKAFVESELFTKGGTSREALASTIQELMSLMEPSYLEEKTETAEAMRRLLFAGGVLVAAADGISDEEIAVLEQFFGEGRFKKGMNVEAIRADLPRRARAVVESVPPIRRIQVIRDLCLIALADREVEERERALLYEIAKMVEVDPGVVDRTLANAGNID